MYICIFELYWRKLKHYEFQFAELSGTKENPVQKEIKEKCFIRDLEFSKMGKNYMLSGTKKFLKGHFISRAILPSSPKKNICQKFRVL